MTVVLGFCTSESKSNVETVLARVKARYGIQKADDYVIYNVNKETVFDAEKFYGTGRNSDAYHLLGLLLGKKPVVWLDFQYVFNDRDIHFLLKNTTDMRCAQIESPQGSMLLLYRNEGRDKALALLAAALNFLNTYKNNYHYCLQQHTRDITFGYLSGICLGYALDDINFYFQQDAFHNFRICNNLKIGYKTKEDFEQFLANEWINLQERTDLEQAALKATSWLDEHSNTALLEQYIASCQKYNKDISIKYDVPYASFVRHASIKRKVTGVLSSAIANTLTLGGLIPWL